MDQQYLDEAIRYLREAGAAHSPGFLHETWRQEMMREVKTLELHRASRDYLNATQCFLNADYTPAQLPLALRALVQAFAATVRANTAPNRQGNTASLAEWRPDEVVLQRYDPGLGISWHTDQSRNSWLLTAIFNLHGRARFQVERSSTRRVYGGSWSLGPGDLVLLRGKGFQGVNLYGLPRHMVDECTDDRLSLILRMCRPAAQ
jgi:alkylated DNA repair dioxygenase AlkB